MRVFALRQTVEDNPEFSREAQTAVLRNFYVDDLLYSCKNEKDAISRLFEIKELVSKGWFNLTEFTSNSQIILDKLKANGLKDDIKVKDISDSSERVLGLLWNTENDTLSF